MDVLPSGIEIEMIKGRVPNFITARKRCAEIKKREETAAAREHRAARPIIFCQFCGRYYPSMQSLRAHLSHCKGKRQVLAAATEGISFRAGFKRFKVRATSIKLYAYLERVEITFEKNLREGADPDRIEDAFYYTLRGAQESNGDGVITFDEEPIPPGPSLLSSPEAAAGAG